MKNYIIRDMPDDLWRRVKIKAAVEGRAIRSVIEELLQAYVDKGIDLENVMADRPPKRTKRRA